MLADPTFYFWFNVILGVIFCLCPLIYGFKVNQKVFAIGGLITSFAVVFFAGWLLSLLCAAFFCLLIWNENKKRIQAENYRKIQQRNIEREEEESAHSEKFDGAWSGELINKLNGEESTENDEPLFEDEE